MSTRSQIIFLGILGVALIGVVVFNTQNSKNQPVRDYKYEIDYDYLSRETDEVNILIYKKNLRMDTSQYYYSIAAESFYLYFVEKFPDDVEKLGAIAQFSMTEEYIEGLSVDNNFIFGKFIDSNAKQQIGHWTFDLEKKEFAEVVLNFPK